MSEPAREAEVRRVLERYLVEIVEAYGLCPWARGTRQHGELTIRILWGAPTHDEVREVALQTVADPGLRVAMLIFPELYPTPRELRDLRAHLNERVPAVGIADFHPAAELDLATPARLVPFLRRSPDPLLQIVPIKILDSVRTPVFVPDRVMQVAMLDGTAKPTQDIGDTIADANHVTVGANATEIVARLADIAADRARSYARVGISASR